MSASDRVLLSALADHSVAPRILDIHLDDCEDDACTGCEPQHLAEKASAPRTEPVESFTAPDHSVWCLRRTFIDKTFHPWHWDGQPFRKDAGPAMASPDFPLLRMPLIALIAEGLHSDTSAARAAGEMAFQFHDMCDAGLIGGTK